MDTAALALVHVEDPKAASIAVETIDGTHHVICPQCDTVAPLHRQGAGGLEPVSALAAGDSFFVACAAGCGFAAPVTVSEGGAPMVGAPAVALPPAGAEEPVAGESAAAAASQDGAALGDEDEEPGDLEQLNDPDAE